MNELNLDDLKQKWNQVLDEVLAADRITWLAFFDARLAAIEESTLVLDFRDSEKFGGQHDYTSARSVRQFELLSGAIYQVTGVRLTITAR